ncbi:MAG: hypothetical protein U0936_17015 [Planctomycetaceae bacterium]
MTFICEYSNRFFDRTIPSEFFWLCRKTDWWKLLQLPDFSWLPLLIAAACVVVVVWAVVRLVSRVNEDVDPAEADREMLQALNDLRREGDLTEDEFRSIKGQITGRLHTVWSDKKTSATAVKTEVAGLRTEVDSFSSGTEFNAGQKVQRVEGSSEAVEPDQSETSNSLTNVPKPSQNTADLAERRIPPESEKGEGLSGKDELIVNRDPHIPET